MARLKNPVEILKLLDKSNCRKCGESTCLAFAASVFNGKRSLVECPNLGDDIIERFEGRTKPRRTIEQDMENLVAQLKKKVVSTDLSKAAARLDARFLDNKLTLRVCGKKRQRRSGRQPLVRNTHTPLDNYPHIKLYS